MTASAEIGMVEFAKRVGCSREHLSRLVKAGKTPRPVNFGSPGMGRGKGYRFKVTKDFERWILRHKRLTEEMGLVGRRPENCRSAHLLLNEIHYPITEATEKIIAANGVDDLFQSLILFGSIGSSKFVDLGNRLRSGKRLTQLVSDLRSAAAGLTLAADILTRRLPQ